jgi:hypothetical protein
VSSILFSPSGRLLATASTDGTALVWDAVALLRRGRTAPARLSGDELAALWQDLAGADAAKAYRAIGRLATAPAEAVPWLRDHLRPVPAVAVDAKRLDRLLAELDSDDFAVRGRATREIEAFGELAQPALERVLAGTPSAEVRARVEELAERCAPARSPERLRGLRAIEVLEQVGTAEARAVLVALAKGAPEARLTREAKAALERLGHPPHARP